MIISRHGTSSFSGKSATLEWITNHLPQVKAPGFLTIPVQAWQQNPNHFLVRCQQTFGNRAVAVRSDAHNEDGLFCSHAGQFLSLLDVAPAQLASAIDRVVESLPGEPGDQIMVQAMVQGIELAGVASTHRVTDGAPWYCIELAALDSCAVTSGRANGRQIAVARHCALNPEVLQSLAPAVCRVLRLLLEVENLTPQQPLEIEFAFGSEGDDVSSVFLLQARPLTTAMRWPGRTGDEPIRLPALDFLLQPDPLSAVVGQRSLLSLMSDWNPAELIGTHPRPLALSLFQHTIACGVWWQARAQLGYAPVPSADVQLLRVLHGRPMVDLRRSANSLLPSGLPTSTSEQLINGWMARLDSQPELHDKVEFQIYRTARDFNSTEQLRLEWNSWLSEDLRLQWEMALSTLTQNVTSVSPQSPLVHHLRTIVKLDSEAIHDEPWNALLSRCQHGTLAFAALARLAFIGEGQLRSAVQREALTPDRALLLRATSRNAPMQDFELDRSAALSGRHGHLRPGTFDIRQNTWGSSAYLHVSERTETAPGFSLLSGERIALQQLLDEAEFMLSPDSWVQFVQRSAAAREWGKHVFSRHLSAAMDGIAQELAQSGLDSECASWLTIEDLQRGQSMPRRSRSLFWIERAGLARQLHNAEASLILSPVLRNETDRAIADSMGTLPNFVGNRVAEGPLVVLKNPQARPDSSLRGAIVATCQADPGFDWLFDCGITGLITAWGGSNSHMAIRCAEFGLSAAIGCGEAVFSKVSQARHARLDPKGGAMWLK